MIGRRWSNDKPRDRCRGGSAGCQGATARGFGWGDLERCAFKKQFWGGCSPKFLMPLLSAEKGIFGLNYGPCERKASDDA
ncbi:hypothetical protein TNIN_343401 [Trichonephila inaurata madagascariensis]|uniref:Uncharacterized protein n=1 Tax=Trichonephila inaurata madagascariensis TaxID=2747483 RepID=A0A8X7C1M7_9ARAC|nr:hypothetical protein TNIN_343401 [Trichonephila inaurata madagascariensis]